MSRGSMEARDTGATTETVLSLDLKTESRLKTNSKSMSDSKSETESVSKTTASKTVDITFVKDANGDESFESGGKISLKGKLQLDSKSKSKSKSKSNSESKSKSKSNSKSKSDSMSNSEQESKSKSDQESTSKLDQELNSKSDANPKLVSQPPVASWGGCRPRSKSKTESDSKSGTRSRSKTESISKPDSLMNRLESGSAVESSNNVVVGSNQTMSKSKSESDGKADNQRSTDSGQEEPDSRNNAKTKKPPSVDSKESSNKKGEKKYKSLESEMTFLDDDANPNILPTKNNPLYNTTDVLERLDKHPLLKMRRDGKYYLKVKDVIVEEHPKVKKNKRGDVIPTIKKEALGHIERVVSRFCEDVLCISRAQFLPLSSQGERHLIWVGKKKANHIIRYMNGNGCYIVNRFPGDIFVKDKQVMGIFLRDHILMRSNQCYWKCGMPKEETLNAKKKNEDEEENPITYRICRHMVKKMITGPGGCDDNGCYNLGKHICKHLDVFIPEVQSFCTYNALQDFSNRLEDELKGQTFVCKPAYLYKGLGFRFFKTSAEFQEFYHMTEGKETSRHDFMVQRLVDRPYLFNNKKVDIRAFLLVVVLRYRRVVSFIHYGFCRVSASEFEMKDDEEEEETPLNDKDKEKKQAEDYDNVMRMLVCTYLTAEEKEDRKKRLEQGTFYGTEEDRSQELKTVFSNEKDLKEVKEQIRHIGIQVSKAIENKVWDSFGCFQLFGLDLCVDQNMKVWLIEVNSHAMSQVDTLSPTQRKVVPAVIMEALGLVVETTYKSFHYMRLRKSPTNEFEETGFLFRQNYDFIFTTLAKKRMDYVWPKPPKWPNPPFFERIGVVDKQIKNVEKRKKACLAMKIAVREEQLALKRKRMAKDEEES